MKPRNRSHYVVTKPEVIGGLLLQYNRQREVALLQIAPTLLKTETGREYFFKGNKMHSK